MDLVRTAGADVPAGVGSLPATASGGADSGPAAALLVKGTLVLDLVIVLGVIALFAAIALLGKAVEQL